MDEGRTTPSRSRRDSRAAEPGCYAASPNTLRPRQAAKAWPKAGEREETGPIDPVPSGHSTGWGLAQGFADSENEIGAKQPLRVTDGGRIRNLDLVRSRLIPFCRLPRIEVHLTALGNNHKNRQVRRRS